MQVSKYLIVTFSESSNVHQCISYYTVSPMLNLSLRLLAITFFTTLSFLTSSCFTGRAHIPTVLIGWAGLPKLPFEGIFFVIFLFFYVYRYILFVLCCLCVIPFLFYGCNNNNLYSYSKNIIYIIYVYMIHISIYYLTLSNLG